MTIKTTDRKDRSWTVKNLIFASALACFAGSVYAVEAVHENSALRSLQSRAAIEKISIIDAVRVEKRVIAVGVRGQVFVSDDEKCEHWIPRYTGVEKTLTSITFLGDGKLLAFGHSGIILYSENLGDSWIQVPAAKEHKEALLASYISPNGEISVIGGYATYLGSSDGGKSWVKQEILSQAEDKHFYGLSSTGKNLILVGESGLIAVSENEGKAWRSVRSPYSGSLFGVVTLKDGAVIAYGMRGKILRSLDGGKQWSELVSGTDSPFFSATTLTDGRVVLAGKDGVLSLLGHNGDELETRHTPDRRTVSKIIEKNNGEWLVFGDFGVRHLRWNTLN